MTATITCGGCNHGFADTALYCPNCGRPKVRESATDPLLGKLLGERFQVHALLGQGASGTIYRAEHITLRRKVAIKVLHAELSRDDLAVERFRREATTVAEIDNEHIVEIHDFGRTPDGRLYLAMELLEGEGLDAVLVREQQLSVERTADILIQVGEALMEAHAIGYVHRDLRPRNMFLTVRRGKANFVKLLDFGLAKLVETEKEGPATRLGMTFGDPRYMSPEQARGDRIDRRADIYQLGCVAYEMLTGAPPFVGQRVFEVLTRQVTEAPAPLPTRRPGVPLWLEAAVTKMLAKDPENRFATTSRMVDALRRGLETGEVMDDAIARRRESIPPPSVSRVMQRMGITEPASGPVHAPVAAPMDVASAAPSGPLAAPGSQPYSHVPAPVAEAPSRRSTGTPRVGVPIVHAPPGAAGSGAVVAPPIVPSHRERTPTQPPVAGTIERGAGVPRRPASQADSNNISQVWYDEGDRAEADGRRARRTTGGPAFHDSVYDEDAPPREHRTGKIVAVLGVLAVGGVIAFAMTRDREPAQSSRQAQLPPPATAAATVPVDAAPSVVLETPDAATAIVPVAPTPPSTPTRAPGKPKQGWRDTGTIRTSGSPMPSPTRPSAPGGFDFGLFPSSPTPGPGPAPGPGPGPLPTPTPSGPGVEPTPYDTDPSPVAPGPSGKDTPQDPYGGELPSQPAGDPPADKASFFANLGTQQLMSGDTSAAAGSFKKALELDTRNVAAITGIGEIALRQGLFGDAIAHLRKAARLAPRNARVFVLLGEAQLGSGNSGAAAETFKKALQLEPDNARARDGYNEATGQP